MSELLKPGNSEADALRRRRKLAEMLMQQGMDAGPATPAQAIARIAQAYFGNQMGGQVDGEERALMERVQQDEKAKLASALQDYDKFSRGDPGLPLTPNDDEGNAMPAAPIQADPRKANQALVGSGIPMLQQQGLARMLATPKEEEPFTLKPGEVRFGPGARRVAEVPPEAPKKEGPKEGQIRTRVNGGTEIQESFENGKWTEIGRGPRWQPPQSGDGTPKPPPGYRWKGAPGGELEAIPGGPATPKPTEQYLKNQTGVQNVQGAITEYRDALKTMNAGDWVSPGARARMGTIYNNMLLQAKEAYNLGVLNGPDYKILQEVVTNPMSLRGLATSRGALDDQAKKLDEIMGKIGGVAATVNKQPAPGGARRYNPATGKIE